MPISPGECWVPISALNHYVFCPRRCYSIHVEQLFFENIHTVRGHSQHRKAHTEHEETRAGVTSHYQMPLVSQLLGLTGKADRVDISSSEVLPIEYKSGARKRWSNDRMQLCAQVLCLEEMLDCSIEKGVLFYHKSRRREEILMTGSLREQTLATVESIRELLITRVRPEATYTKRCEGCSFLPHCLPVEVGYLKAEASHRKEE